MVLPGYGIGELTAVIAMFVMFMGGETVRRHESLRTVLGCFHGLAVLAGMVWGLWQVSIAFPILGVIFRLGNVLNFVIVAAMLSVFYPERKPDGSTMPFWETTFGPFLMAACWGLLSVHVYGRGFEGPQIFWVPALFLAVHYYLASGVLILMLLFDPPGHAPAAALPLGKRFKSGFGVFWIVLMVLWWGQAPFLLQEHWHTLFGKSWPSALSGAFLSGLAIFRSARYGHQRVSG